MDQAQGAAKNAAQSPTYNIGKVLRISGTIVDAQFGDHAAPEILHRLLILRSTNNGSEQYSHALKQELADPNIINLEVAQHLGDGIVRCIALEPLDGIRRGLDVIDTKSPIMVPIGKGILGHVFDAMGQIGRAHV